jgi:MORN repeat
MRHGQGKYIYEATNKYSICEGQWKENKRYRGKLEYRDGRIYEGMFEKDL